MTSAAGIYGGAKNIELMADHLLTYMTLGEVAKFVGGRFDLREFSGAQPLVSDWLAPQEERDTIWYFRDVTPSDLAKPLNVAMVGMNPDEPGEFVLHRYRSVQPKDVRGRVMREYPMYVRTLHAWVGPTSSLRARRARERFFSMRICCRALVTWLNFGATFAGRPSPIRAAIGLILRVQVEFVAEGGGPAFEGG